MRDSRGGGIGLEPVYAEDVLYKETSGNVTTAAKTDEKDNTIIKELTVGGVKIGSEDSFTGISISGSSTNNHVTISDNGMVASGGVFANIIDSGLNARMSDGNVVAKKGLYIGYTSQLINGATYDNSTFAVNGENGSFKAANGAFNVSAGGAITADSLTLDENYNVKQNIEDAKTKITTVEGELNTNKANLTALQGKVDGHDTEINTLKTKTEGITRKTDDSTTVDGVNFKNSAVAADGVAANKITANNFVTVGDTTNYVHMTKEGIAVSGRLYSSLDPNATDLKSVSVAEMANTRDNTNKISYNDTEGTKIDSNVIINKGKKNQVAITEDGIVVGLNSSVVNDDGVFAGGHDYDNAKAAFNANDGSIKGANGKFTVDDKGNVVSKGSVTANQAGFNDLAVTNGLTVGDNDPNGKFVNMQNGSVVATGSVTAMGDLAAVGNLYVSGQSTFTNGVKTDKIEEATADAGVTVDGVVLKDGGISAADGKFTVDGDGAVSAAGGKFGVDKDGNATVGGTLDVTGNTTVGGTLDVTGDTTLKGKLDVTGDTTLKGKLDVTGNATVGGTLGVTGDATFSGNIKGQNLNIGTTGNEFTVDTVGNVKANGITTSDTTTNKIGGVTLAGSDINAKNLTLTGTLTAAKYNANDIEATNSIKVGATTMTNGKLDLGSNGTIDFGANELTDVQVGNINSVIQPDGIVKAADGSVIGGVTFSAGNVTGVKDLTATGKVTAATITDGTASLSGGALTGLASVNIGGNTTIDNTGINTNKLIVGLGLNATTIDDANGVVSAKGEIGAVKFSGSGKLDNVNAIDGVSVAQNSGSAAGGLTFGGNAIIGATGIPFQSTGFKVDDDGDVEGKTFTTAADGTGNRSTLASGSLTIDANNTWTKDAGIIASNVKVGTNELKNDGLHVGTNTTVKDGELTVGAGNTWSMANGITASKAGINGVTIGETEGKATFNNAGNTTTIDGDKINTGTITADKLLINKISLGKDGSDNISIDQDGDVTTKGEIRITDAAGNVMTKLAKDSATFGNDVANQTVIEKGTVKAKAKSEDNQQAGLTFNENGLTVSGQNAAGQKSSFSFNAKTGANTFTGQDGTTTAINGSAITSTNGSATGVLNGSNLTLTNGTKSTALEAGKATYTGKAGSSSKHGTTTTIDGGVITTDTLNVERIQLGEKIVDQRTGETIGSGVTLAADGGFTAAGGNFKVVGGATGSRGSITNVVGDATKGKTVFETNQKGANMSFEKGGVTSNVSVGDSKANVSAGNASIDVVNGSITDKVGGTTVESKDGSFSVEGNTGNGMKINTNTGETTFTGAAGEKGGNTTTINGGNITTDTLNVERINLGGEMVDKNGTSFGSNLSMDAKGNFSAAGGKFKVNGADGAMTNTVGKTSFATSDDGVNSSVTKDDTHKSEFNQGLTSIGGVVTNGEIKVAQKLDGETGKLTSEVKDANGSSKLEQSGTGLEYTDSAKPDNATRINSSDVSIGSATDDSKRINLSDLGQIDDLDGELTKRDEYKKNQTAVGGINAEAAIRREEVARLDNRIDDVNTRVDKVGAMAAAIASLKSIGYDPQAPSEFSIGLGQYKGETGVAMGFFHYPNKNFMINVSLSTAGGETMGGIGATWRFGYKSPQKLLEEQREAQAKKELAAAEKYQAAAKLAKEAQERAEYAAKLARQAQVSADNAKAAADATQAKHFG